MNPNDPNQIYEQLKSKSTPDLYLEIAKLEASNSKPMIARLIIQERQTEAQHKLNMTLLNRQLRWMKFSAILNAIVILLAVLLGWYLKEWKSQSTPVSPAQQSIQFQPESSSTTSPALRPERKNDKDTLQPPR
jgi:hypothetical protein